MLDAPYIPRQRTNNLDQWDGSINDSNPEAEPVTLVRILPREGGRGFITKGIFRCPCGQEFETEVARVKRGQTKCCKACLKEKQIRWRTKHGHATGRTQSREYKAWAAMWSRVRADETRYSFQLYRKLGVSVCDRWLNFENFLTDMGPRPPGRSSVDRYPDCNGNYEPSNCRWAMPKQQSRNLRTNRLYDYNGRSLTIAEILEVSGCPFKLNTVRSRLSKGIPLMEAISAPLLRVL